MTWREIRIKELEKQIKERQEWLKERAEFTKKLEQWIVQDKKTIEELRASK